MPHTAPSLEALKEQVAGLRKKYKDTGKNDPTRLAQIKELESLSNELKQPQDNEILLGAMTFHLYSIVVGCEQAMLPMYNYQSSSLFQLLQESPYTSKENPIYPKDQLIYLKAYTDYAVAKQKETLQKDSKADAKEVDRDKMARDAVLPKFKPVIDRIAKTLSPDIEKLLSKARQHLLSDNIASLPECYEEQKGKAYREKQKTLHGRFFTSFAEKTRVFSYGTERKRCLAITRLLSEPHVNKLLSTGSADAKESKEKQTEKNLILSQKIYLHTVRTGYLFYLLSIIPQQTWTAPENSTLYKECLDILGVRRLEDFPETDRNICIANFRHFLQNALHFHEKDITSILKEGGIFSERTTPSVFIKDMIYKIDAKFGSAIKKYLVAPVFKFTRLTFDFALGSYLSGPAKAVARTYLAKQVLQKSAAMLGGYFFGLPGAYVGHYAGGFLDSQALGTISSGVKQVTGIATNRVLGDPRASEPKVTDPELIALKSHQYTTQVAKTAEDIENETLLKEFSQEILWIEALDALCPDELSAFRTIRDSHRELEKEKTTARPRPGASA